MNDFNILRLDDARQPAIILDPRDPISTARKIVTARFMNAKGRRVLHRYRGDFWQYGNGCYRIADDDKTRTYAWIFLEKASRLEKGNVVPFRPTRARVLDVLDAMGAVCQLDAHIESPVWLCEGDELPPPAEFMAVANGLLHLPSGELYPPTPDFFGLNASDVAFDLEAPQPRQWAKFLDDVFGDDRQAINALQEWFGYTLTTDTAQQKILLLVGPTRSGKGTIARVQTSMIGRDSVVAPTLQGLSSNFGLAPLIGKPIAIISDARLGSRSDHAAIAERLLSISGEDTLTIDRKFRPAWTGRLPTRFLLLTNELPRFIDSSGALAKRFIILELRRSFYGREDHALMGRLLTELPGILNWAREGYERLRQRGHFVQPASARDAIETLETLASPVIAFVRERCELRPCVQATPDALYKAWCEWCDANGRCDKGTLQIFCRDLRAAVPSIRLKRPRHGNDRSRIYEGIGIL